MVSDPARGDWRSRNGRESLARNLAPKEALAVSCGVLSADVHGCMPLSMAVVTQLVTRLQDSQPGDSDPHLLTCSTVHVRLSGTRTSNR